jgi:hypothetical protein
MTNTNVLSTEKYDTFKFIKGNRPIVRTKITNLIASYEKGLNLFPYCPVLVNESLYVIDGQHRYEVCKRLGLPVYYCIVPDFTLHQIAEINSAVTKWSMKDYLNCYIETGATDYKTLSLFKDKYGISVNVAIGLLANGSVRDGGGHSVDKFKEGLFKVVHQERAEKIMKHVTDYSEIFPGIHDRNFIVAVQMLLASKHYNHKEVVDKLHSLKSKIEKQESYKDYILHLEALFNHKNYKRKIIYS